MLILEFTSDIIKLLELAGRKRITINGLYKKSINGLSDEAISGAISDLLSEHKIKKIDSLIVCVPRYLVTVRTVRLPSVDEAELKDMVALQAGKQLPYPASELIWDFKIIEKRPDGYSDIFLAIAHKNAIDRFVNILKEAHLEAGEIILNSEAILAWYLAASNFYEKEGPAPQARVIINVDSSCVDVIVSRGGSLEFSRSFATKENPQEIAEEINKTFYSYEKENPEDISSVIMTGIEEKAMGIKPILESTYGTDKIEFIHPMKILSVDSDKGGAGYADLGKEASFSALLGIAYNNYDIKMNFLPEGIKAKNSSRKERKVLFRAVILLSAIALVFCGIMSKRFLDIRHQLNLVNSKIRETDPKVVKLKEASKNIEIIKRHLDMKGSSVDVIREIYNIVPQGVSIAVLDFELAKSLTLRGAAGDLSSVFKFASDLEKSSYFEKCQIKYAQKRLVKTKEVVDFELNCKINP